MPPRTRAATQSSAAAAPEAPAAKRAASRPNAEPAAKSGASPAKEAAQAVVTKTPAKASPPAVKAPAAKRAAPAVKAATPKEPAPAKAAPAKTSAAPTKATAAPTHPVAKAVPARPKAAPEKKAVSAGYSADERFLTHQRVLLGEERVTYLEQARNLRAEAESLVEEMEPGDIQFDEESGEGGTVTVDRERDLALSAQALLAVEEIDDALRKIGTGRYGICEGCGELIPKARLEALPYARLCIACKNGGLSRR